MNYFTLDSNDAMWSTPIHPEPIDYPSATTSPSSFTDVVLVFAGVFLQACSNESKLLNFLLLGTSYHHSNRLELPFDLELFGYLCSWLRSVFAMVLLIVVRKFVMDNLSPVMVPSSRIQTHDGHWMLVRDLLFHLQCRFCVCTVLCLLPAESISPVLTNCLVLVASTLSQPVFQRELQSACRRAIL